MHFKPWEHCNICKYFEFVLNVLKSASVSRECFSRSLKLITFGEYLLLRICFKQFCQDALLYVGIYNMYIKYVINEAIYKLKI